MGLTRFRINNGLKYHRGRVKNKASESCRRIIIGFQFYDMDYTVYCQNSNRFSAEIILLNPKFHGTLNHKLHIQLGPRVIPIVTARENHLLPHHYHVCVQL